MLTIAHDHERLRTFKLYALASLSVRQTLSQRLPDLVTKESAVCTHTIAAHTEAPMFQCHRAQLVMQGKARSVNMHTVAHDQVGAAACL
eukprot:4761906-Pleurochrysis_carterae.AAC.10